MRVSGVGFLAGVAQLFAAFFALILLSGLASAQVQVGSTFNSQGPAPRFGPANAAQSADATPNGTESGAIQAILVDPALGANTLFAASVNGGIWKTTDGGTNWTPLTDKQSSLSVATLSLDPNDPTGKTIIAGLGITSNGEYSQFNMAAPQGRGGLQNGLLYSTDGGASWSQIGTGALRGQSVIGVAVRSQTILAATFEEQAFTLTQTSGGASYGLYRSTNGGASFSLVSGTSGLPNGAVTSLVADPANPNKFYAAVTSVATPNQTGVYVSNDLGNSWSPVFTQANSGGTIKNNEQTVITLATGPNGSVALAVSNVNNGLFKGTLSGVFLSQNGGSNWNQINLTPADNVVPGGQTPVDLRLAIDPSNPNVIYLAGDAHQTCDETPAKSFCSVIARRIVFNPGTGTSTSASLTFEGTYAKNFADANTVHADTRALAFDSSGRLLFSSDGGIYVRNNPQSSGTWQGLNGNLSAFEPYMVTFDANSKRAAVAAQDNGVSLQSAPGGLMYNAIHLGDGLNVGINDKTLSGLSAIYTSSQSLGILSRMIVNSQGQAVSPFPDVTNPGGINITCNGGNWCNDEVGAGFSSPFILNRIDPTRIALGGFSGVFVTQDALTTGSISATSLDLTLSKVGSPNPTVIAYGTVDNTSALLVGGSDSTVWASKDTGTPTLKQLTQYSGIVPTSASYDLRTQQRFFITDSRNLWYVTNGTAAPGSVTFTQLTAALPAGFIRPSATEFISANGVNAILVGGMNAPLTCTSSPNGCVVSAQQSPIVVADSNGSGNLSGWRSFGSGLPNALVDTMFYNPAVDVLVAGSVGRGVWTLYDVTSNFASASVLQFGLANNDSVPDSSVLFGNRPLIKYGTGMLTVAGNATYTGNTTVVSGAMIVNGSIASSPQTTVASGAILGGTGTVGNTLIDGGVLMPGNPMGTLTVQGNLVFTAAASYLVQVTATGASKTSVTGTATLGGAAVFASFSGASIINKYLILSATGGVSGTFGSIAGGPAGFATALSYDANDVYLNFSFTPSTAGLNVNQKNVIDAVANAFNNGATLPLQFAALGPAGLSQASGETATGSQQTTFQAMTQFLQSLLDPFISGRGEAGSPQGGATPYAEETEAASAYAATGTPRTNSEREAYAAVYRKAPFANTVYDQRWSVWAAGFGGSQTTDGSAALGSNSATSRIFGTAVGADYLLSPRTIAGFALAGGGTSFSVSGFGSGRSDLFQAGAFVRHTAGQAYVAGALAYGWQDVTTDRTLTIAGVDRLRAEFNANAFSGRLEGGYRFITPWMGITPYAAAQFTTFNLPAYVEQVLSGGNMFALAYGAKSVTDPRSELGIRTDRSFALQTGILTLRGRLAWAHDYNPDRAVAATFQTLPGASFVVNGAAPARDSALTTVSAEMKWLNGWSAGASFEGEFSNATRSYAGKGMVRYAW